MNSSVSLDTLEQANFGGKHFTARLTERALAVRYDTLSPAAKQVAHDCVMDWFAVTLAGSRDASLDILSSLATREGKSAQGARLVNRPDRVSPLQAALVNGTASHLLDYDDVNMHLPGHPSVTVLPALLALAEREGQDGTAVLSAFAAGYDACCRLGRLMAPNHYARGFHSTATIGTLGASIACAHLMRLDADRTAHAIGLAVSFAAGLQSMFGTSVKPLHAGRAAHNGLYATLLASLGFDSRPDAIECERGFADVLGATAPHWRDALEDPPGGSYLMSNLFKFHASCFGTHAAIECAHELRAMSTASGTEPADIVLTVAQETANICNIAAPRTALESKFSLTTAFALAFCGLDTANLDVFSPTYSAREHVAAVASRVRVQIDSGFDITQCRMAARMGQAPVEHSFDCGVPQPDKAAQSRRVRKKFDSLAVPVIGSQRANALAELLSGFEAANSVHDVMALAAG